MLACATAAQSCLIAAAPLSLSCCSSISRSLIKSKKTMQERKARGNRCSKEEEEEEKKREKWAKGVSVSE